LRKRSINSNATLVLFDAAAESVGELAMTGVFYADLNRLESQSNSEGHANNSPITSTDDCFQLANTFCGSGLG
jgi:hypothetical protein